VSLESPHHGLIDLGSGLTAEGRSQLAPRPEIVESWRRSARSGVRADTFDVPYEPDVDADGRLYRAAKPVLDQVAEDLIATNMSLVLTDERADVLDRRAPGRNLRARLDQILLAPGFCYGEGTVGTNAIGTALEQRGPSTVEGDEHFAEALGRMACAAVPIEDPRTGRHLGAVDLTSRVEDANPLMMPLAKRAAWEIEQRLLDDASMTQQILREHLLRARRGAKGPVVSLNEATMISNTAAAGMLRSSDQELLWDWAQRALRGHRQPAPELRLASGFSVVARCKAVTDGDQVVGALVELTPAAPSTDDQGPSGRQKSPGRSPFGWASLTDAERTVAEVVAEGLTNAEAGARLFLSHHTVGFHLRQIFRKLDVSSRVELTRLVADRRQLR
jgi:transcriptional regulator of acetoin/glycerol metabolism/DNA-binding CsgD family transcriptional regulator